jgi:hypothetical protein
MNNTPTLMDSEEKRAPWNNDPFEGPEQYKIIEVTISQTLSSTQEIQVPIDFDETDTNALERAVNKQIMLPSDCLEVNGYPEWVEDDFCVML